jgi:parvulin-like peptidyl-prolyl isomerase
MKLAGSASLIEHVSGGRGRMTAVALLAALTLLGGFGIFAQKDAANPPLNVANTDGQMLPDLPGVIDGYPPVVAYVDGHAIASKLLAIRLYALEQSPDPNLDKSHSVRDALHYVIRDLILIDHAQDYGISVSFDEARAEAQREKALLLSNPAARADIATRAQQLGVSVDDYFELPSAIQGYRQGMTLGEMQQYILNRSTISPPRSETQTEAALDAFANGIHAKVQVLIEVQ